MILLVLGACDDASVCDRGETQPCLCLTGGEGAQVCSEDRQGWEPCVCDGGDGDADSDSDGDGDGDLPEEWVVMRAGTFTMGASMAEPCADVTESYYRAPHEVTLTRDFELYPTEVSRADFEAVMGYDPSRFDDCGERCPVESVSWNEAVVYCNALSDAEGLDRCYLCTGEGAEANCSPSAAYTTPYDCRGYRLPTEAEWEYAARAGADALDHVGWMDLRDQIAWYSENSSMTPHDVAQKAANLWGLYDMMGNVWEWSHDWQGRDPGGTLTDPWGAVDGHFRVLRGGGWGSLWDIGYPCRYDEAPTAHLDFVGFRPARTL